MIAKYAFVECPECQKSSRIRISAYNFQEGPTYNRPQGNETQYVASDLHRKCNHCGAIWAEISLFENVEINSIVGVAVI